MTLGLWLIFYAEAQEAFKDIQRLIHKLTHIIIYTVQYGRSYIVNLYHPSAFNGEHLVSLRTLTPRVHSKVCRTHVLGILTVCVGAVVGGDARAIAAHNGDSARAIILRLRPTNVVYSGELAGTKSLYSGGVCT